MANLAKIQRDIVTEVWTKITQIREAGALATPEDYNVENAIQAASIIISQTVDKNKKPVLETCTPTSIANSILKMVVMGLNPLKNQCYFSAYRDGLNCQPSYFGNVLLAKRYGGVKEINTQTIYNGDKFVYEIEKETGLKKLIDHKPDFDKINMKEIRGAYAIAIREDGSTELEVMNINQIKEAWLFNRDKETDAHKNFTDEMCEKTVSNRLAKKYVNNSNDIPLLKHLENDVDQIDVLPLALAEEIENGKQKTQKDSKKKAENTESKKQNSKEDEIAKPAPPESRIVNDAKKPSY